MIHNTLLDFEIQTGPWIRARRPDLVLINQKKKNLSSRFAVPVDNRKKMNESEKVDTYLDLARE